MADSEQVEILREKDGNLWNEWRKDNASLEIDFTGTDFAGMNLVGKNLKKANLAGAKLSETNLTRSDLTGASFRGANLAKANLRGAKLIGANFVEAVLSDANGSGSSRDAKYPIFSDFSDADFSNADLRGANLSFATLSSAILSGANLQETDFQGAGLQRVDLTGSVIARTNFAEANLKFASIDYDTLQHFPQSIRADYEPTWFIVNAPEKEMPLSIIVRSISFAPEHYQAALSILSYFGSILREKYPHANAKVSIEQEGLNITLIIETDDGMRERIERTLDDYGQVIIGNMSPEEFLNDPLQGMELSQQLRIAEVQLENKREQLRFAHQQIDFFKIQLQQVTSQVGYALQSSETQSLSSITMNPQIIYNPQLTNDMTIGDRVSDQAQKILNSSSLPASYQELTPLLSLVQKEIQASTISDGVKAEMINEVEGAAIQTKKDKPEKAKIVERLKNATSILEGIGSMTDKAVMVGQLLAKGIEWVEHLL